MCVFNAAVLETAYSIFFFQKDITVIYGYFNAPQIRPEKSCKNLILFGRFILRFYAILNTWFSKHLPASFTSTTSILPVWIVLRLLSVY